ncbi:pantetheine-phosphate adenylyltransferase [Candidatus Proelusimicrobium excrementi]|uniref:pantetheine-phosphate adenylyltransferase n=1 Tax=Candidatus Proelusimicrobium excrementi TaxID=3416222 RepID=UPI003C9E1B03|nr:pantetheine-phosphate adenylyltransferase [Elusimicrobiaceae bacterium]
MKNIAVYPGTFDPVTNGHLDIIRRAADIFDEVIVAVLVNKNKRPVFSVEERLKHLKENTQELKNVKVDFFDGLLADYMKLKKAKVAIRGLRALTDLEYEFILANTNRELNGEMETVFLMPSAKYTYLTSSMVREAYSLGGRLKNCVPPSVEKELVEKYKK